LGFESVEKHVEIIEERLPIQHSLF
jgi:hypothetical protein